MLIRVTQAHIDRGVRCDGNHCAVAVAIANAVFWPIYVGVCGDEIYVGSEAFSTPPEVIRFIEEFDAGRPVDPIEFELPIDHLCPAGHGSVA